MRGTNIFLVCPIESFRRMLCGPERLLKLWEHKLSQRQPRTTPNAPNGCEDQSWAWVAKFTCPPAVTALCVDQDLQVCHPINIGEVA